MVAHLLRMVKLIGLIVLVVIPAEVDGEISVEAHVPMRQLQVFGNFQVVQAVMEVLGHGDGVAEAGSLGVMLGCFCWVRN